MFKILTQLAVVALISGSLTFSQNEEEINKPLGANQHDGFFLRMMYGIGYGQLVEADVLGSDMKYSGAAQNLTFQIGGTVANNLILFGEFGGIMLIDPKFEWMGVSATANDVTVSVFGFGGGITYYIMPSNIYFSLSLVSSQASTEYKGSTGTSQYGFGINGMIGKEWWVGEQWGLGLSIYGCFSTMKDEGSIEGVNYSSTINNFSAGVMFSATYN